MKERSSDKTSHYLSGKPDDSNLFFLESLDKIERSLRKSEDLDQMMKDVLDSVLSIFTSDRAWLLYPCDPDTKFWNVPMERTREGYPGALSGGVDIPTTPEAMEVFQTALDSDVPVAYDMKTKRPLPPEAADKFGIRSQITTAVYPKLGSPWLFGMHQCSHPRIWLEDEQYLFHEIGRRIADALNVLLLLRDLRKSEAKYRLLFNSTNDAIFVYQPGVEGKLGNFIETNEIASQMYGYTKGEFLGLTPLDLGISGREAIIRKQIKMVLSGGHSVFENTHKKKDGKKFHVEISAHFFDLDGKPTILSIVRDITERKRAEEAISGSEKRYRAVFEKSTDAIFIVDRKSGRYIDVNEAGVQLTGRNLAELKQLTTRDVVPDRARERLKLVGDSNTNVDLGKVTYVRPDGTHRVAILSAVPIDSETVIGIARDITDELAMEDQLRQTHKMEAIGTLAGGIAHDFNNILSAILGYSELVLAELPPESAIKNKIEAIYSSGERARDLVAQILAFSRKDEQVRSPIELHLIVKDALKLLRPAIPATIEIQTQISSKGRVLGDPSRIHQVIMNLCTNAAQAMLETGGTLKISLSDVKVEGVAAALAQITDGSYVKLVISDTGVGIPPENLERIFDPYFTTKETGKGTGLGLAVVHGIIKSHGGAIKVESQVGKGTVFEVSLPLSLKMSQREKQDEYQIPGGNERILLVDDEPDILEVEKEMLKRQGYTVTAKNNAREALELFAKQPEQFDLVISDMTMPDMTGDKLAAELSKILPNIPIILCSGFSEFMSKKKAESLGIDGFLTKPVSMRDLSSIIRSVLDKKTS